MRRETSFVYAFLCVSTVIYIYEDEECEDEDTASFPLSRFFFQDDSFLPTSTVLCSVSFSCTHSHKHSLNTFSYQDVTAFPAFLRSTHIVRMT